jgi:murein DD-endopeptidase
MVIKWDKVSENEKKQFEGMSELNKFIYFLLLQFGSPYGWGKENPVASDCSGAVCMALYAATGHLIRTTADDLYRRVFTVLYPKPDQIKAVFFITKKDGKHGDRMVAAGTATHVAGIIEDGIVLNSQEPYAKIRQIIDVSHWYQMNGFEVAVRGLNKEALEKLAAEGKTLYGLDDEFKQFFNLGV